MNRRLFVRARALTALTVTLTLTVSLAAPAVAFADVPTSDGPAPEQPGLAARVVALEDLVAAQSKQLVGLTQVIAAVSTLGQVLDDHTKQLAAHALKLGPITVNGSELQVSGVNVVISNGGVCDAANGLGNLIVGCNEMPLEGADRGGSHNVVIGPDHSYSSLGGLVAGVHNTLSAPNSTIVGGESNVAAGERSSILGGISNRTGGERPPHLGAGDPGTAMTIAGGAYNVAWGRSSSVAGGYASYASGPSATICGGSENIADGQYSVVGGGNRNHAVGIYASAHGGQLNEARDGMSAVVGGAQNLANGWNATIAGGESNVVRNGPLQTQVATITGGHANLISNGAAWSLIHGGCNVEVSGESAVCSSR